MNDMMMFELLILLYILASHTGESQFRNVPDSALHVTSILIEPYLMENPEYIYDNTLPHYFGYIPDLMTEIADKTGIGFVIRVSPDNTFGYKQVDGTWNGMIGQLLSKEADIAAAPMYVTKERQAIIDFTISFMDVYATLLLRKPLVGSELNVRSVAALVNQSEIRYGTLNHGVLIRTLKSTNDTLLKVLWRNMLHFEPSVFTISNEEGIRRVHNEKYVYVLPHTIGEYMSMRLPCDLVTVERFLMKRKYSLAIPKESVYKRQLDLAIQALINDGKLEKLYRRWWIDESQCNTTHMSRVYGTKYTTSSAGNLTVCYFCFLFGMIIINRIMSIMMLASS